MATVTIVEDMQTTLLSLKDKVVEAQGSVNNLRAEVENALSMVGKEGYQKLMIRSLQFSIKLADAVRKTLDEIK